MITVQDIAFVRYQVTDLERMESFLRDFGLYRAAKTDQALYMRAAGPAHHVHVAQLGDGNKPLGFGFRAGSVEDLHKLAAHLGARVEVNLEPGGGQRVRFTDPAGFLVDVIHGQTEHSPLSTREPITRNAFNQRKRVGAPIRLRPQSSSVVRIGHLALLVADFPVMMKFYQDVLGFKPSDTYWAGTEGNTIAAFMRCGLGEQWTDHHTLALITAQDGQSRFDHSAFEVVDLDDLVQGGEYLKERGYRHSWGVGRHIQGSQIFDYWRDPFGNKIEHWTDGDLVNDQTPVGNALIDGNALHQWAPPLTPEFFE
jgi:catechol-2,3-dioxygenase